jgi:hypothetical protein
MTIGWQKSRENGKPNIPSPLKGVRGESCTSTSTGEPYIKYRTRSYKEETEKKKKKKKKKFENARNGKLSSPSHLDGPQNV